MQAEVQPIKNKSHSSIQSLPEKWADFALSQSATLTCKRCNRSVKPKFILLPGRLMSIIFRYIPIFQNLPVLNQETMRVIIRLLF